MDYPHYPEPILTSTEIEVPKLDVDGQMEVWDLLSAAGFHPIPKSRWGKSPYAEVWKRGQRRLCVDREEALKFQKRGTVSGWMIFPPLETERFLVVDMDVHKMDDPVGLYYRLQRAAPTQMVIHTPSNGVHLYYRLPDGMEAPTSPKSLQGIDLRSPAIGAAIAISGAVQYVGDSAASKGLPDGHVGYYRCIGRYEPAVATEELLSILLEPQKVGQAIEVGYRASREGSNHIHRHYAQELDKRIKDTREALDWALQPNMDYERWTVLWMAAYHATDGSVEVRDYILGHPSVVWSDGQRGKDKFCRDWDNHVPREEGVTAASLFYYARQNGWLTTSTADVDDEADVLIHYEKVSEWIDSVPQLPRHALVMSQTGSGKTWGFKALYNRAGHPKSLVLVPSIRLALDMAKKLRAMGLPAEAYRDEDTQQIRDEVDLVNAHILVTTLQTFTRRVYAEGFGIMNRYGLVWLEECDQLLRSFSRSLGEDASHVTQAQSVVGFSALQEAFRSGAYVWGVDATATRVSVEAFNTLSGNYQFVKNTWVTKKPDVVMMPDRMTGYAIIASSLQQGKSVVVACDTKSEAELVVQTMVEAGYVREAEALAVTADTGLLDDRVLAFSTDANAEASKYRLLSYNSAMASGVSVDGFIPDVVVLFASGYLTPRVVLQLLNRYRKQYHVFAYYNQNRRSYHVTKYEEILQRANDLMIEEAEYAYLLVANRTDMALLRDRLRAIAIEDEQQQRRSPYAFFIKLLEKDGREVKEAMPIVIQRVVDAAKTTSERRKSERGELAQTWRQVPPYKDVKQMPATYDLMDIKRSLVHAWVKDALNGNVPQDENPQYVYETLRSLHRKSGALTAFVRQSEAVRRAERGLADKERARLSLSPTISRVVLASSLRYIFNEPQEGLTDEELEVRALPFMRVIEDNARLYHAVIRSQDKSLMAIRERYPNDVRSQAIAVIKNIATTMGMRVRKTSERGWHVANIVQITDYLSWYYGEPVVVEFRKDELEAEREKRRVWRKQVASMPDEARERLMQRLTVLPMELALHMKL